MPLFTVDVCAVQDGICLVTTLYNHHILILYSANSNFTFNVQACYNNYNDDAFIVAMTLVTY